MSEPAATQAYLDAHFLRFDAMADAAGIAPQQLRALVDAVLIPAPSYVVRDAELVSAAFGPLPCAGLVPGEYMHRDMQGWIDAALETCRMQGDAAAALRESFAARMRTALLDLHREGVTAPGCFNAHGEADATALDALIASHWEAHLEGIFGICVRQPGSITAIAHKETTQALLGQLTESGERQRYSTSETAVLRGLIARYAEACAPFTPVEYPRTSRRRYVEDLPKRLGDD